MAADTPQGGATSSQPSSVGGALNSEEKTSPRADRDGKNRRHGEDRSHWMITPLFVEAPAVGNAQKTIPCTLFYHTEDAKASEKDISVMKTPP
ncbi:MAG: hypothetical protein IIC04_04935 [Proteobacteria bacterium]|nr:hypothetical protein [Pseudomonadota bacterium]